MKVIEEAIKLGACKEVRSVTDIESLVSLFFSPQGREFCISNNYPTKETFEALNLSKYGVFVDREIEKRNSNIGLIGGHGVLTFDDPSKTYLVILMHGATADIHITNYCVVRVEGEGARVECTNNGMLC